MKKILLLSLFSFLLFSCNHNFFNKKILEVKATEEFVQGSEDIPLLYGMERINDEELGFDSSIGSIINTSYVTQLDIQKVKDFYEKTLPQMGWKVVKNSKDKISFKREKEKLEIEFMMQNKKDIVRFFIYSAL